MKERFRVLAKLRVDGREHTREAVFEYYIDAYNWCKYLKDTDWYSVYLISCHIISTLTGEELF